MHTPNFWVANTNKSQSLMYNGIMYSASFFHSLFLKTLEAFSLLPLILENANFTCRSFSTLKIIKAIEIGGKGWDL